MVIAHFEFATKYLVPLKASDVIHRQRLIDLLHNHIERRVQVISAPAGYGKTTLLVDFANDLDTPVCWYSLDTTDQDPRLLLEGILASIRLHFQDFGQKTQSCLRVADDMIKDTHHLIGTLTGEIYSAIPDYFIFVLEDYHFIENSSPATNLLNLLIDHAPDNCHIILSSRGPIDLPAISKAVMQRRAARLSASHLSFTPVEIKELLGKCYGLNLSDSEADGLATKTDGWIIGILLNTHSSLPNGALKDLLGPSQRDVFQYLTSEVYERQPADIRRFLLETSILNNLEPELCDRLTNLPNSKQLLQHIERQNLFTQCINQRESWYRYHHLFREFLQAKLLEESPEQFVRLHCKAAAIFEQEQQWNEAIIHFLTAKRYDEALRVIKNVGEDFQNSGKWITVSKWIEALPTEMRLSDPDLILLHAQSFIHLGEVDEAVRALTHLLDQMKSDEDWLYRAKALSWRSAAFRLTGHLAQAKSDIKTAINILKQNSGPAGVFGDAYRRLGYIHAEQGRLTLALRHMRGALKHYSSIFDVGRMAEAHNTLGTIRKRLGDLVKANMHFEHALVGWQKVKNLGALAMTLNNMGMIYQRRGQYDLALDTLRSGLGKAHEAGYQRAEALILINMAEVLRDLDLHDDALTTYQKGLELARQVMETHYVAWARAGMGETYRLLGDHDKAEVLLKEAICQAEEKGQSYETNLFTTQLGIIEYERGRYDSSTEILHGVCNRLRDIGDKDGLAKAYFHMSQALFLAKKYRLAIHWLGKVCKLADELGYDDFLATEGRNAVLLIQYGASKAVGGDRLSLVLDKIQKRRDSRAKRLASRVVATQCVTSKPDIEVYAFGETQILLNGRVVKKVEWRSNRAKELFFYLLDCGTGQTKEEITASLWPDLSPARVNSNFHINLYRVRRATSPGIFERAQGQYRISPRINIWYDVAEFEHLLKPLSHDRRGDMNILEQAVNQYQGHFMGGFYSEWIEMRRRQLEDKYLKALSSLAEASGSSGDYDKAAALLEKFIAIDPYHDEVHCQLIEHYLARGDKVSAFRSYERYFNTVTPELEVAPPSRMRQLGKRISADIQVS